MLRSTMLRRTAEVAAPEMAVAEITDIRIELNRRPDDRPSRLLGYCSVTLGGFVVRNIKLIGGKKGLFLAMPSYPTKDGCPNCDMKNDIRAPYCNWCGHALELDRSCMDAKGRPMLYHDTVFPKNAHVRAALEAAVFAAYEDRLADLEGEGGERCSA